MSTENKGSTSQETTPGTSAMLFPESFQQAPQEQPVAEAEVFGAHETEAVAPEAEAEPASSEPEFIDLGTLAEKKTKVKVEGKEDEVTIAEVLKGYQTDRYLTQKGQAIARERQELAEQKRVIDQYLANLNQPNTAPAQTEGIDDSIYNEYVKPFLTPILQENETLKAAVARIEQETQPVRYEAAMAKIDADLKTQGIDDFARLRPMIEQEILAMPDGTFQAYNTPEGFKAIAKDIKLRELLSSKPAPAQPRPKAPVMPVEGSSTPSGVDDNISRKKEIFERAQRSGSLQDWAEVLAAKGIV